MPIVYFLRVHLIWIVNIIILLIRVVVYDKLTLKHQMNSYSYTTNKKYADSFNYLIKCILKCWEHVTLFILFLKAELEVSVH